MPNALVSHIRGTLPAETQGKSDAELTLQIAQELRARGDFDAYRAKYPDFERELLDLTNAGGDIVGETMAAGAAGLRDRLPGTLQSAGALGAHALARDQLMQEMGLAPALTEAGDALAGMAAENRREAEARIAESGGRTIQRLEDVRPGSPRDWLLWALPGAMENAPSMLGSLGAGVATGLVTRNPAAGLAAAAASSVGQNAGEIYGNLEEAGAPRDRAIDAALAGGTAAGALDVISQIIPLAQISRLFPGASKSVVSSLVADVMGRGGLMGALRGGAVGSISEGGTEALQEAIGIAAEEYATGATFTPEQVRSRMANAGALGAVMGGPVGAATGAIPGEAPKAQTPAVPPAAPQDTDLGMPRESAPPMQFGDLPLNDAERSALYGVQEPAGPMRFGDLPPTAAESLGEVIEPPGPLDFGAGLVDDLPPAAATPTPQEDSPTTPPAPPSPAPVPAPAPTGSDVSIRPTETPTPGAGAIVPAAPPKITIANFSPARIARSTSDDLASDNGSGGTMMVAIETPDGSVELRNVYESHDKTKTPVLRAENVHGLHESLKKGKGKGRSVARIHALGWQVHGPLKLAKSMPNLVARLTKAQWQAMQDESVALHDAVKYAIKEGRQAEAIERFLRESDPLQWLAVEFLAQKIAADLGASPSHVVTGLGTRIDSQAVDAKQATTVIEKFAAGQWMRRQDGKVFGVFTDPEWEQFVQAVGKGEGDAVIEAKFGKPKEDELYSASYKSWAEGIRKLGEADQIGKEAFVGKGAAALAAPVGELDAKAEAKAAIAATETTALEAEGNARLAAGKELQALEELGLGIDLDAIRGLIERPGLKIKEVHALMGTGIEFDSMRRHVRKTRPKDFPKLLGEALILIEQAHAARQSTLAAAKTKAALPNPAGTGGTGANNPRATGRGAGWVKAPKPAAAAKPAAVEFVRPATGKFVRTEYGLVYPEGRAPRTAKQVTPVDGPVLHVGDQFATPDMLVGARTLNDKVVFVAAADAAATDGVVTARRTGGSDGVESKSVLATRLGSIDTSALKYSRPSPALYRASHSQTARAWARAVAVLREIMPVEVIQAAIAEGEAFYRQTGGRTDGRRFMELVLKDVADPSSTDMEVVAHEAVHVLFQMLPQELQSAIHAAVARLADPDPALNASLTQTDPLLRSEEKLAVLLQRDGHSQALATGIAARLGRLLKEVYLRVARAVATALGRTSDAEGFALEYFRNRMAGLLAGDFAPQSVINALGGRPLSFAERAGLLPGFGRQLGGMVDGMWQWAPKIPDSEEAVAFNHELACMRYSRPNIPAPLGSNDPRPSIHRDIATQNHQLALDLAAQAALGNSQRIPRVLAKVTAGGASIAGWMRTELGLANPADLIAGYLQRIDPTTQQPVQGLDPQTQFANLENRYDVSDAKIAAYQITRAKRLRLAAKATEARTKIDDTLQARAKAQKRFMEAHRDYLSADGLTKLIMQGMRKTLAFERRLAGRTYRSLGVVMQQLRELDARADEPLDRAYSPVFARLFTGKQLAGRSLFGLLDAMVNDAAIDFQKKTAREIRDHLQARQAGGLLSADLEQLLADTDDARALLATLVAYGKTNADVLVQIERRRMKSAAERQALQAALDKLIAVRDVADQMVPGLARTSKLEERARAAYQMAKRKDDARGRTIENYDDRLGAISELLPLFQKAEEELARELGGPLPEFTFGHDMPYPVPVQQANGTWKLEKRRLSLDSDGTATDRDQLAKDKDAMAQWLEAKRQAGEFDPDYRNVKAALMALEEGGYYATDVRKTDTWVIRNVFLPEGAKAGATGLPSGRLVERMFNRYAVVQTELAQMLDRIGVKSDRLRARAIAVLNRDMPDGNRMTVERYHLTVLEPALSIAEKARDLWDQALTKEQLHARIATRIVNTLSANDDLRAFIGPGKAHDIAAAVMAHAGYLDEASGEFRAVLDRYGVKVRDERLAVDRFDGEETAGMRDALPVGPLTVARKSSSVVGDVFRQMVALRWATDFKKQVAEAIEGVWKQGGAAAARQTIAPFFAHRGIIENFVGALASNDTHGIFPAPVLPDGVTKPDSDPVLAARAWQDAKGDVVAFIELMYAAHNGTEGIEAYAADVMATMQAYFSRLRQQVPAEESGMTSDDLRYLSPNLMIDARTVEKWPTAWLEHYSFDRITNSQVAQRIAAEVAFGRDTDGLAQMWGKMEHDMKGQTRDHETIVEEYRKKGLEGKELKRRVLKDYQDRMGAAPGKAEYERLVRLVEVQPYVEKAKENIRTFFSSKHNQTDSTRFASALGNTIAFGLLQNLGTTLNNLSDLFSPLTQGGVSKATMKQVARNWKELGHGVAGSVAQMVGLDLMSSSRLQRAFVDEGFQDAAAVMRYLEKTEDGWMSDVTNDKGGRGYEEAKATRAMRLYMKALSAGVTRLGEKSTATVLRPLAPFKQAILETARASTISTWRRVEDMIVLGLEYADANPAALRDPTLKLTGKLLGLGGAEARAFDYMADKLEQYGLNIAALVREAKARQAGPRNEAMLMSRMSRAIIHGYVANEMILDANIANMTSKAWSSTLARLALPLWGWPIRRAMQVVRMGLDQNEQYRLATVAHALGALGVMAGAGLAMSLAADQYHERIVGRKRNLRSVGSIAPALAAGEGGEAFTALLENLNRAGTFGLWGEVINTGLNLAAGGGDNRVLSLDQRVVMVNSMFNTARAIQSMVATRDVEYTSVVRPILTALGGNSMLQHVQIASNALDLDTNESRFMARINAQNILKVAGREMGLEVRGGVHVQSVPTPVSAELNRMVLATYANDRADFQRAWRAAIAAARANGERDPLTVVRDRFAERNPLKNSFKSLGEGEYARLLRHLDERSRAQVREAVNRFNVYAGSLGAAPYYGSKKLQRQELGMVRDGLLGF